jgi:hypothetical protein
VPGLLSEFLLWPGTVLFTSPKYIFHYSLQHDKITVLNMHVSPYDAQYTECLLFSVTTLFKNGVLKIV